MRLGIFGGTFDPVHTGHLLLAESCREQARLDEVWFLPAAVSPLKLDQQPTSVADRIEMLRLALAGHEDFALCLDEVERGGVSFTVETLGRLKAQDPTRELFFLLGADALATFSSWRDPQGICRLATLVVVNRAGSPEPDFSVLSACCTEEQIAAIRAHRVQMPWIGLSSREIRRRVSAGLSIRYQVPRAVEMFLTQKRLYR